MQVTGRSACRMRFSRGKGSRPHHARVAPRYAYPRALATFATPNNSYASPVLILPRSCPLYVSRTLDWPLNITQHYGGSHSIVAKRHISPGRVASRDEAMGELVGKVQGPIRQTGRLCRTESGACQHHWRGKAACFVTQVMSNSRTAHRLLPI
jgi:hypothetical protein